MCGSARDDLLHFLARIHGAAEPSQLDALRIFERDLETEREVVRDVRGADGEDFYGNRHAFVVDDDGDGLAPMFASTQPFIFWSFVRVT
jgi:hypothetical protein